MYSTDLDSPISKSNSNATRAHSSTLRSNASSAFYYYSGGRRRSRPFTYGFGVGGGRKRRSKGVQNWIRCLTVFAYFILVSSPALLLSFYYTRIWDPTYLNKMVSPPLSGNFGVIGNAGSRKFMAMSGHGRVEKFSLRDILPKGTIGSGSG